MIFVCFDGSWRSLAISLGATLLLLALQAQQGLLDPRELDDFIVPADIASRRWNAEQLFMRHKRAWRSGGMLSQVTPVLILLIPLVLPFLARRVPAHARAGPLPASALHELRRRIHAMPIEPWRPEGALSDLKPSRHSRTGDACVICFEKWKIDDPLRRLPCDCAYHVECIDRWAFAEAGRGNAPACPLCRREI